MFSFGINEKNTTKFYENFKTLIISNTVQNCNADKVLFVINITDGAIRQVDTDQITDLQWSARLWESSFNNFV